ncbi:MAG: FG-GAP-like repeat-containing protein [Kofleriaceae bacterium]
MKLTHPLLYLAQALAASACSIDSTSYTPEPPTVPAPRLPMNNAYWGSVHTGKLAPRFVWEPSTAKIQDPIRYELQYSTDPTFAAEVRTVETDETAFQVESSLPVSLTPPVGARYFWRLRSCVRNSCSEYSRPWYVNVGRVIKDYNGDGYSDLAIGAPGSDAVEMNGGRVYVYFGGPGEVVDATPDGVLGTANEIMNPETGFGSVVSYAGDMNGDGFADLIVAVPAEANRTTWCYLYLGAKGNVFDEIKDLVFQGRRFFGWNTKSVGDVDGDGFDDLVIMNNNPGEESAQLFKGGTVLDARFDDALSGLSPYSFVEAAGDVNGDGFADILIGEPQRDVTPTGIVTLYSGTSQRVFDASDAVTIPEHDPLEVFGTTASSGDVNGDGFSDVVIGILQNGEVGDGRPGRAYVYMGSRERVRVQDEIPLNGVAMHDSFGRSLESGGDVNGDGYADVAVNGDSKTFIFHGGPGAGIDTTPDAILESGASDVRSTMDLNGDGNCDLVVPVFTPAGRVDIYWGIAGSGIGPNIATTLSGAAADDYFGSLALGGGEPAVSLKLTNFHGRKFRTAVLRARLGCVSKPMHHVLSRCKMPA